MFGQGELYNSCFKTFVHKKIQNMLCFIFYELTPQTDGTPSTAAFRFQIGNAISEC